MAAVAHGSILLGAFTSGIGGIFAALIIWVSQREKSTYAAHQSLQALVYQSFILLLTVVAFCSWGALLMILTVLPMVANPDLYQSSPPQSMWVGLSLLIFPCGLWLATILYGLWGAMRCLSGADFKYAIIGNWLEQRENTSP